MIAVTGLAGFALAADKSLATVPLTSYVLGSACTTIPASLFMRVVGRRAGFQSGTALGILGSAVCSYAIVVASFWLLCAGMFLMGCYTAFGKYYRFAAADGASVAFRPKAVSWVMAGGVFAGVLGPQLVQWTMDIWPPFLFAASFVTQMVIALVAMAVLAVVDAPPPPAADRRAS